MDGPEVKIVMQDQGPYKYRMWYDVLDNYGAVIEESRFVKVYAHNVKEAVKKAIENITQTKNNNPILSEWSQFRIKTIKVDVDYKPHFLGLREIGWLIQGLNHVPDAYAIRQKLVNMYNLLSDIEIEKKSQSEKTIEIREAPKLSSKAIEKVIEKLEKEWNETGDPDILKLLCEISSQLDS